MKIRFLHDVRVEETGRHSGPVFKAGSEHDLSLSSAQRWLRRGVAVEVATEMRVRPERPMMVNRVEETAVVEAQPEPPEAPRRGRKKRGG